MIRSSIRTLFKYLVPDRARHGFVAMFRNMQTKQLNSGKVEGDSKLLIELIKNKSVRYVSALLQLLTSVIVNNRFERSFIRSPTTAASST